MIGAQHHHFILHKPQGYLSQFKYEGKRKSSKRLLGELHDFPEGTMAIGRLDEHSEGLLFLTTDGKMSEYVRSSKVEKEYIVQVDGVIGDEAILKLKSGVKIGLNGTKYRTKPCKAALVKNIDSYSFPYREVREERHGPMSWASLILKEGKFRQVRKMTAAVGYPTLRLIRVRIGKTELKLTAGEVMEVTQFNL